MYLRPSPATSSKGTCSQAGPIRALACSSHPGKEGERALHTYMEMARLLARPGAQLGPVRVQVDHGEPLPDARWEVWEQTGTLN
jgi:hypothetical protein